MCVSEIVATVHFSIARYKEMTLWRKVSYIYDTFSLDGSMSNCPTSALSGLDHSIFSSKTDFW